MHLVAVEVKNEQLKVMIGVTCEILFEGEGREVGNGNCRYYGYTPNYHKVAMDLQTKYLLNNEIITCKITSVLDGKLLNAIALKEFNHYVLSKKIETINVEQIN